MKYAHSGRLERWLGKDQLDQIVKASLGVHTKVAIANIPGSVYAMDGELYGRIDGGFFAGMTDRYFDALKRLSRKPSLSTGFASLSDLISEATTGGKREDLTFMKSGTAGIVGRSNSLWNVGSIPAAGGVGGTTGTGAVKTRTSTGALKQTDPGGSDTLHFVTAVAQASVATNLLMAYDRLWDMTHTMTVDPRAVDTANVPTRYQTAALAPGNFISGEVTTVLPAATPTIAFTYVDQDGNTAEAGAAFSTIASAAAVNTIPFTAPNWKYPLNNGDTGVRSITNVDLSAAMASGVVTWFIGHPLVWIPQPVANSAVIIDGINSAFNLVQIQTGACIAFLEIAKGATTATNYWGNLTVVAG